MNSGIAEYLEASRYMKTMHYPKKSVYSEKMKSKTNHKKKNEMAIQTNWNRSVMIFKESRA